jgi:hypothetical protein
VSCLIHDDDGNMPISARNTASGTGGAGWLVHLELGSKDIGGLSEENTCGCSFDGVQQ